MACDGDDVDVRGGRRRSMTDRRIASEFNEFVCPSYSLKKYRTHLAVGSSRYVWITDRRIRS